MVQGQRRLDQAGDPGGGHGVSDHGLHRAEHGPLTFSGRPEHLGQRGEFGGVTGRGGRAVRLQQAERAGRRRVEPGRPPGRPDGPRLAARVGVGQARRAAVTGDTGAPDHRVHPVPVALGVGEPLEHHDACTLADQDAVGVPVEGANPLAGRERSQLREHAPQRDVVAVVHTARQHHVAAAGGQFADGLVHRDQRGGAGCVHGVGRSAQVQPVGQPGGGQVGHQADRRLRLVRAQLVGESLPNLGELTLRHIGQQLTECTDHLVRTADALVEPDQPGRQVPAPAQHHADPVAVRQPVRAARVGDGGGSDLQGDQLVRLGAGHRARHQAEGRRPHLGQPVHEAAAPTVEPVRRGRSRGRRRVVVVGVPAALGDVRDRIHPADQVPPVGRQVRGPGQQDGHPHHGDRRELMVSHRRRHQPEAV